MSARRSSRRGAGPPSSRWACLCRSRQRRTVMQLPVRLPRSSAHLPCIAGAVVRKARLSMPVRRRPARRPLGVTVRQAAPGHGPCDGGPDGRNDGVDGRRTHFGASGPIGCDGSACIDRQALVGARVGSEPLVAVDWPPLASSASRWRAGTDAFDDAPLRSLDGLDLETLVGEVLDRLTRQVIGGEAHGQRFEESLEETHRK